MVKKVNEVVFLCSNCGNEYGKWSGTCSACGEWGTLKEVKLSQKAGVAKSERLEIKKIGEKVPISRERILVGSSEFERVIGGGIVPGSVILFAGEPGIGKSTLLSQIISKVGGTYVGGEESAEQIGMRIERLDLKSVGVEVLETNSVDQILDFMERTQKLPNICVVDSIQVVACNDATGGAGSPSQIRESTLRLVEMAKRKRVATIIVGHVTKEGDIAGPKMLEHMVDCVVYLEGDKTSELRILRCLKNRFGPTDEVGVYRMSEVGLVEVRGDDLTFAQGEGAVGSALTIVMDGNRPMMLEIQALVVESFAPQPKRVFSGIGYDRGQLMCAVAQKHLNMPLYKYDVFLQVTGGIKIVDTAADLAIVVSLWSSFKEKPLKGVYVGEVSLLGNVKLPRNMEKRKKEIEGLGKKWVEISSLKALR